MNLRERVRAKKVKNFTMHIKQIYTAPIIKCAALGAQNFIAELAILDGTLVVTQPKDFKHGRSGPILHSPGLKTSDVYVDSKLLVCIV